MWVYLVFHGIDQIIGFCQRCPRNNSVRSLISRWIPASLHSMTGMIWPLEQQYQEGWGLFTVIQEWYGCLRGLRFNNPLSPGKCIKSLSIKFQMTFFASISCAFHGKLYWVRCLWFRVNIGNTWCHQATGHWGLFTVIQEWYGCLWRLRLINPLSPGKCIKSLSIQFQMTFFAIIYCAFPGKLYWVMCQ